MEIDDFIRKVSDNTKKVAGKLNDAADEAWQKAQEKAPEIVEQLNHAKDWTENKIDEIKEHPAFIDAVDSAKEVTKSAANKIENIVETLKRNFSGVDKNKGTNQP
jgi:esterase/lipase